MTTKLVNRVCRSVLRCAQSCAERAFKYTALSHGSNCWCGNVHDAKGTGAVPSGRCSALCVDDKLPCGAEDGNGFIDVYEYVRPPPLGVDEVELVGCFNDKPSNRDLPKLKRLSTKVSPQRRAPFALFTPLGRRRRESVCACAWTPITSTLACRWVK